MVSQTGGPWNKGFNQGGSRLGYVFNHEDARRYSEWFLTDEGSRALALETGLIRRIWASDNPQKVLDVGCGTGIFTDWFAGCGHQVTGLEPSPHMLNIARLRLPPRIPLDEGYAEDLPYDDNSFDTVALITTLEFVRDPVQALEEAFRVATRHVLLGVLNKFSLITLQRFLARLWRRSVLDHARFFSVFELQSLAAKAISPSVKTRWGTCLALPTAVSRHLLFLERSPYFQWNPFGHFIVMCLDVEFTLRCLQDPLFSDMSSHLAQARPNTSCVRSLNRRDSGFSGPGGNPAGDPSPTPRHPSAPGEAFGGDQSASPCGPPVPRARGRSMPLI